MKDTIDTIPVKTEPGPKFPDLGRLFRALQRLNLGPVRKPDWDGSVTIFFGSSGEHYNAKSDAGMVTNIERFSMLEKAYAEEPEI